MLSRKVPQKYSKAVSAKIQELGKIVADLGLCLKSRIAAWHVLCLYPGEPKMKAVRRSSVEKAVECFRSTIEELPKVKGEIRKVGGIFQWKSTRREHFISLYRQLSQVRGAVRQDAEACAGAIKHTNRLLAAADRPIRMFLEYSDAGVFVGARQL